MEETQAAAGGPPVNSIEVQNNLNILNTNPNKTTSALASGRSTPTTVGTSVGLATANNNTAAVNNNTAVSAIGLPITTTTGGASGTNTNSLPPTVPYRSAAGLASESPAAVTAAMHHHHHQLNSNALHSNAHMQTAAGGGGASVSTISPGSLAGNGGAVQFTARDASALGTPDLGLTTPNHHNSATNTGVGGEGGGGRGLSIVTTAPDRSAPPSSSAMPFSASSNAPSSSSNSTTTTSPTSRPSPRSAQLRSNLHQSRSTLNASLNSFYQTQNTHLEGAFGALMTSIQEHTEELDVHRENLDRLDQEINGPGDAVPPLRPAVSHLQADLSHLQTNVKSIREEVDVVYDQFQDLTGTVGTIERNVTDVGSGVQQVKGRVEEVDGRVTTVESTSATHLDSLRAELDATRTQLALLSNDVTAPTGKVATLTSRLDTMATELSTTQTTVAQQIESLNGTTTQLLQKLETDTLRKFEDMGTAHAQAVGQIESTTALVQTLIEENAALRQVVDANRMQEAQNRAALEQSVQGWASNLQAEMEQDRTSHQKVLGDVSQTNDTVDRIDQDVQGLRLLDRERNRQLVELSALPQLLSSLQAEVDGLKAGQAQVRDVHVAATHAREEGLQAELAKISRDVDGLRLLDQSRAQEVAALAALREELATTRSEVAEMKSREAEGRSAVDRFGQDVEMLRLADQDRRGELEDVKARSPAVAAIPVGAGGATATSRGIDLNAEISRVQEKTKQLRSSPPSSGTRVVAEVEEANVPIVRGAAVESADSEPGEIVMSLPQQEAVEEEDDPNDQINAALDGLRKLQESLNRDRVQAAPTSAADRLNARSTARSVSSAPSSAHSSPIIAARKDRPASGAPQSYEKAPKAIESTVPTDEASPPEDTLREAREEVSLLRQARKEINASLATLKMGSAVDVGSPPGSPSSDFGSPGHTPAPAVRPSSTADPIADAARRRLRDGDSPMVADTAASSAPDPTAPNVSRGGAFPSSQAVRASSIGTGTYCEKSVTTVMTEMSGRESSAPTPVRYTGTQLDYESAGDHGRGVDPPDEVSAASGAKAQRYSDPPEDDVSSLAAQVPYYKVPPVHQEMAETVTEAAPKAATLDTSGSTSDAIETMEVATENKGVILIQKTTDERKKYQYYNPVEDTHQVVEQQSSSVEREVTETSAIEVVAAPSAPEPQGERNLGATEAAPAPQSPSRESKDKSPESSPDTSKWSTKSAGELIEQRRMQRMLAARSTMEAAAGSKAPPSPPAAADNNLSPRSTASSSSINPPPRDGDHQRSVRQQQMRKARSQGQRSSSAVPPSRHRSIVEEAIQFARASRGSPAAPSKDMATSPKEFLNKQSKATQQRRKQQRMEKDFGPSPTNANTTQMLSPRMDSEQSMVVTPDEKSPKSANNLGDDVANGVQLEPSPMAGSPDDFENLRRATGSGPSGISSINAQQQAQIVQPPPTTVQSNGPAPGCYLVYLADSGGKLVLHYSKTPVDNAIGFWRAGQGKSIQGFKYRQNSGRVELIKGIAGGDANKRKFFSGWCQFIKAAAAFNGSARKFPNVGGLEIELYAHSKDGTCHYLDVDNEEVDVCQFDAIACLPKNNNLFKGVHALDVNRFVNTANIAGAALPL
mmetsp:Transcript_18348/g.52527  ORF Transcript_18348/g.52527 Transcript_18348/m.52527 type:complete len:1619 (-) Transcript_18348:247-5103(-)